MNEQAFGWWFPNMRMICEKCKKEISVSEGEYLYYQNRMLFACRACANKLNDEIRCATKVCSALDGKKTQAESVLSSEIAFQKFMKSIDAAVKRIPGTSTLIADVPLLTSLVDNYYKKEYTEISYNAIVAVVAALLYVGSSFDMIPDVIPGSGYEDDAMVVAFCKRFFHDEIKKYVKYLETK